MNVAASKANHTVSTSTEPHLIVRSYFTRLVYLITNVLGLVAFLYPILQPALIQNLTAQSPITQSGVANATRSTGSAMLLSLLVLLCFLVLLLEVQNKAVNTKTVALLGVLVAMNVTLRFVETAIPGPGGFSPVFVLIILTGYVYGSGFGFLMGALTIFASALITGGVGPWLPYQMYTAGWVGMTTQICRVTIPFLDNVSRSIRGGGSASRGENRRLEVLCLALFGALWGLLYGMIINLWFWPFATGDPSHYWQPGIGAGEIVKRYATFYIVTSLGWDLIRAVGNAVLISLLGIPVLRVLRRFHDRFEFRYYPAARERSATELLI